jgi:hypothetical protein
MKDKITISRRHAFSIVPDAILEHEELGHAAVRALAWALGRPEGWDLRIGYWCKKCGLTDKTWPKVKKELAEAGFFRQWKTRGPRGVFEWHQEITDAPIYSIPPKRMDGAGRDAPGRGKAVGEKQDEVKKLLQQPRAPERSAGSSSDLHLTEKIGEDVRNALLRRVEGLALDTAQEVLDEAIGLQEAGAVRVSLPNLTAGLVRKVEQGVFQPAAGIAVKEARNRKKDAEAANERGRAMRERPASNNTVSEGLRLLLEVEQKAQHEMFTAFQRSPLFRGMAKNIKTIEDAMANKKLKMGLANFAFQYFQQKKGGPSLPI